jgi:hypothetical protein
MKSIYEIVKIMSFQKKFSFFFFDAKNNHIFTSFTKTNNSTIIFGKQNITY